VTSSMSDTSSTDVGMSVDGEIQLEEVAAAERAQQELGGTAALRSMDKRKLVLKLLTWSRAVLLPLAGLVYWVTQALVVGTALTGTA
jgi:hypothetical protein